MKRFIRYAAISVGILFILLIVAVIVIPLVVNVQKFIPEIEKQVRDTTGRSFSIGPDLGVSFFPWLSISFSDMKIGNPQGFLSDEFLKIRTFEARIKILPLLRRQIQISRFVVGGLSVNLERNDSGQVNWEFAGGVDASGGSEAPPVPSLGLLAEKLSFALFAVTDGQVKWYDRTGNVRHKVEDIMLLLNDFTPDHPVSLDCKATFDGKPATVEGHIGPIMETNNQVNLPVNIVFSIVNKLQGQVQGKITPQGKTPSFDLSFHLGPFSPRAVLSACDLAFPLETRDLESFSTAALDFTAHADREKIAIDKGVVNLDDSKVNFSLLVQNFKGPQVDFSLDLDRIDVDRYLPPSTPEVQAAGIDAGQEEQVRGELWTWKNIAMGGAIRVGALTMHGGTMTEVYLPLQGKDGIITLAPVTFTANSGQVEAALTLDLQAVAPTLRATLKAQGLEAEALLHDFVGWDSLRGTLSAELALQSAGGTLATMKKNLSGEAMLLVRDGALVGVDLSQPPGTSANLRSGVGAESSDEKPRTDFTEAKSVVTINNGLVQIRETSLIAPVCSLRLSGTADIVQQQLNLQMETDFVTTIVGKGGREEKVDRSSLSSISGSFSEPELKNLKTSTNGDNGRSRNNLKHLLAQKLASPVDEDVKNLVGKDLVDPAVVAQRFRLQPETLRRSEIKKKFPVGTGKVRIGTLREEATLR